MHAGLEILDFLCGPVDLPPFEPSPSPEVLSLAEAACTSGRDKGPLRAALSQSLVQAWDEAFNKHYSVLITHIGTSANAPQMAAFETATEAYLTALIAAVEAELEGALTNGTDKGDDGERSTDLSEEVKVLKDMGNKLRWLYRSPLLSSWTDLTPHPLPLLTVEFIRTLTQVLHNNEAAWDVVSDFNVLP